MPCLLVAVVGVVIRILGGGSSLLGRLLLLLALALLSRVSGQGLLQNLENLLVGDLLVRLDLAQVKSRGASQLGDAVLGDGCLQS